MSQRSAGKLTYDPLEHLIVPHPVNRIKYVKSACQGKRVLDLGAYDETEIAKMQHRNWRWLHREIADVATEVLGVDASEAVRQAGAIVTGDRSRIVFGSVNALDVQVETFRPEIIVAGELIEHTPDTLCWLQHLSSIAPGCRFVASTPNATSLLNIGLALVSRENCHEDHLQVYSYKTLATLSRRLGLTSVQILPYYYSAELFKGKTPRLLLPLVTATDWFLLHPIQYLFPLTAFGLILDARFPEVDGPPY